MIIWYLKLFIGWRHKFSIFEVFSLVATKDGKQETPVVPATVSLDELSQ